MPEAASSDISQAILDTLIYSDIFDFPPNAQEIHRYLSGTAATFEDVCQKLDSEPGFVKTGPYFTLPGREGIIHLRETRNQRSQKLLRPALQYGRIMSLLPFVRMVALTGSLAVGNISGNEDFDYMLVTKPGRLWTARAFVLLLNRLARLAGHTLCPNVIITENSLEWRQHDLYSARDLCQMVPVAGFVTYQKLIRSNRWVRELLPNAYEEIIGQPKEENFRFRILRRMLEFLLRGRLGNGLERWEMNRKIERFSRQAGFGEETVFSAEICQGNFDHHRSWTQQQLWKRKNPSPVRTSFQEQKIP